MTRRGALGSLVAMGILALLGTHPATAQSRVQVEFWHGLNPPAGGLLEQIAADFNASQSQYQVNATFKGQYPDTMVAAIAAFRAGQAPHIVQMFEVGTATMMAARGAVKPVHELMRETGVAFDPNVYVPAVRGYYSLPDGRMMSMPFNSSTAITFYNRDAFRKAGLDPNKPPQTWPEVIEAAIGGEEHLLDGVLDGRGGDAEAARAGPHERELAAVDGVELAGPLGVQVGDVGVHRLEGTCPAARRSVSEGRKISPRRPGAGGRSQPRSGREAPPGRDRGPGSWA